MNSNNNNNCESVRITSSRIAFSSILLLILVELNLILVSKLNTKPVNEKEKREI